jgi:hypothetical protein
VGVGIGVVFGIALAGWLAKGGDELVLLMLAGGFATIFAIPLALLLQAIPLNWYTPIRFKDYKPEKGTIRIKFRRPEQAEPLLEAMNIRLSAVMPKKSTAKTDV